MLVLTRKQNEKIQIGEHITITVIRTKGKTVRLGIEAPANMSVLRGELVFDADEPAAAAPAKTAARRDEAPRNSRWESDAAAGQTGPIAGAASSRTDWAPLRTLLAGARQ